LVGWVGSSRARRPVPLASGLVCLLPGLAVVVPVQRASVSVPQPVYPDPGYRPCVPSAWPGGPYARRAPCLPVHIPARLPGLAGRVTAVRRASPCVFLPVCPAWLAA